MFEESRITDIHQNFEEERVEFTLRPQTLDEYIGQKTVTDNLKVFITATKLRGEPLDHVLFYGPPGLGKTTLANIIAKELGVDIRITSGPSIEKAGDLAAILTNLNDNDVLFIDEIHRLNRSVEEVLYSAMEDFALDIIIGKGPSAKSIRIELPPFTLIGATTRAGLLSAPLRDRFGVSHKMEYYNIDEIKAIIIRGAKILGVKINEDGAIEISKRSRGTPRIANRLLKRVRDYCEIKGNGTIDKLSAKSALDMLGVDSNGLDDLDRNIINSIIENYDGGPVGIETLSLLLGEDRRTLEEVYEPYLVKIGFLKRTNRGRVVTPKAYQHFKKAEVKI
mgnify:CR=1 FL=1